MEKKYEITEQAKEGIKTYLLNHKIYGNSANEINTLVNTLHNLPEITEPLKKVVGKG